MVPIDSNGFWSSFTPKNRHVGDVSRTRGGTVYRALGHNSDTQGDYKLSLNVVFLFFSQ